MEKRFIDIKDLSEYLTISTNTIYSWIALKKIPYAKLGKLLRFDLREIDAWMDSNRKNSLN